MTVADGNRWVHYTTPAEFIAAIRQERWEQWATNLATVHAELQQTTEQWT